MAYSLKNEVTADQFKEVINNVVNSKKIYRKRVNVYEIDGYNKGIKGEITSLSELTTWFFSIDFDGCDRNLTYCVYSDNDESEIPYRLADDIVYQLTNIMCEKMLIKINYSSNELYLMSAYSIFEQLIKLGFNNIEYENIKDVGYESTYKYGQVSKVTIAGENYFESGDCFNYNDKVIISWHDYKEVAVSREYICFNKLSKEEACKKLRNLGFFNIYYVKEKDLIKGWINKPNYVKYVQIDNDKPFHEWKKYKTCAKIRIGYHDFKN